MMWRGFGGPEVVHSGGWGIAGMVIMGIFWALVIGAIVWGFIRMRRHGCCMHGEHHGYYDHGNNALDIAKERYAKGEIDEKEFEKIKKALSL
jgi:putative membrane protein